MKTQSPKVTSPRRRVLTATAQRRPVIADSGGTQVAPKNENTAIRLFTYHASQTALDDLRQRVLATRWPEQETVADFSQGVPLATMRKLAHYWASEYDWRKFEKRLNALPQFVTEIDGVDIHFIHVRSKHANALALLSAHGWPGSVNWGMKIALPLTDPTANGGKAEEAFDLVIPSMPGYGFSSKPTTTGWGPARIARAWITLMKRLGYRRFVAHGGDWGAIVVEQMAIQGAPELIGMHTNMPGCVPAELDPLLWAGSPMPSSLSAEEKRACDQLAFAYKNVHYAFYMGSRPQTLVGLEDSPVGLATFYLDFERRTLELITQTFDRKPTGLTRDDVLDNITIAWLTKSAVSGARLYWENKLNYFAPKNVTIPVAVSAFPDELFQAPKSWVKRAYPNLIYYNQPDQGGHFAAWEQPGIFSAELRASFESLR